jgi:hypothetical protein
MDKGVILQKTDRKLLQYSHFSPLSGVADVPENYHTVTIHLKEKGSRVVVDLSQDNNETEESRDHSQKNWEMMLGNLKKFLEEGRENLSG